MSDFIPKTVWRKYAMNIKISESLKHFNYLQSELDAVYHEASLKLGMSDSSMIILYTLCNEGGSCLLNDICILTCLSKQTINSAIRKLEAEDILYLKASDGKRKLVCLTEKGKQLSEKTVAKIIDIENRIFDSWSSEAKQQYFGAIQNYVAAFKEELKNL